LLPSAQNARHWLLSGVGRRIAQSAGAMNLCLGHGSLNAKIFEWTKGKWAPV